MTATVLDYVRKTNHNLSGTATGANLLPGTAPTTGTGVTWNSGTGTATATGATDIVRWPANTLVIGQAYQVTFNYTMTVGSKIRVNTGATNGANIGATSAVLGASGSVTLQFVASANTYFGLEADTANFTGTISAIVIQSAPLLIATSTGAGGVPTTRCIQGKFYAEFTPTTVTGTPSVGIAWSNWATATSLVSLTNALGYLATGVVQINGVTLATIATWAQGNRIDMACDPANHLIWFRVAGGNWNNNVANDPATGVGGIDYSSMATLGTMQAAVYATLTGNVWTAVFSSASWAGAAPRAMARSTTVAYTVVNNVDVTYEITQATTMYGGPVVRAIPSPNDRFKKWFSPAGLVTTVSGVIRELSVAVPNRRVDVYDRITGELLGTTVSAGDGSWSIPCLGRPKRPHRRIGPDHLQLARPR
jgi:hypothetical protein